MVQISYSVEVLEEGRSYHDFEISCPHCSEKAIAVLDSAGLKISNIRKGNIRDGPRKNPNIVACDTCSCVFKVKPAIDAPVNHLSNMLHEMKFPRWVKIEHFGNAFVGHLPPELLTDGGPITKKAAKKTHKKKPKNVKLKKALDKFQ